jgi:hypothetical protein
MATTTTNFGWDIPQSTDLVKDGATAIAALGQDIDTALIDLKGGTTGQVLSKASGTDLDYSWVTTDDANAIQNAIVDAKGDLIAATAADTPARLAVGTNGHVLTADSTAATGLKWAAVAAGGMTLINTGGTALSGATTTVGSIPGTYKELKIYVTDFYASGVNTSFFYLNTDSTASNYAYSGTRLFGSNLTGVIGENNSSAISYIGAPASDQNNNLVISIPNYADTTANKIYTAHSGVKDGSNNAVTLTAHRWANTAAITAINLQCESGKTWSGGTIYVYGVN